GFNDLSYFNRAFRRRYGATPSDVRAAALKG
ncbi:AraC family transcriptional regulator, partial [Mesorhizobium sp. M7A.F.Ca.AU.002.02.1.1]